MAAEAEQTVAITPSSSTVRESGVIQAAIDDVWNYVKNVDFKWRTDVQSCIIADGQAQAIDSLRTVTYDGDYVQTKALRGLNSYDHTATWEMVTSEPPVSYSSARYTIQLLPVTTTGETFIVFTTTYSNDASAEVTQDQKFKLQEGIKNIQTNFSQN